MEQETDLPLSDDWEGSAEILTGIALFILILWCIAELIVLRGV